MLWNIPLKVSFFAHFRKSGKKGWVECKEEDLMIWTWLRRSLILEGKMVILDQPSARGGLASVALYLPSFQ